jgi:CheY-like chemotaxis protein
MDIKMPVLDGISAAEQIGKERIAPVVMLTAFSQKELGRARSGCWRHGLHRQAVHRR